MWLAGGFFMAAVATQSFRSVDRILAQPNPLAAVEMKGLAPGVPRMLLRYQASEFNRHLFEAWEIVQIIGGGFLFFFLLFGTSEDKITLALVLVVLAAALFERLLLTPEITALGRTLDFATSEQAAPGRSRFWVLHSAYAAIEVMKWIVLGFVGMRLMSRHRRSGDIRNELDMIDKANYGHVDR
jgi:hypothetical protein